MNGGAAVASSQRALDRIALVADEETLEPWDEELVSSDPLGFRDREPYRERLRIAAERTGRHESVLTGRVTVHGQPLVVIAAEVGFLGGSIGVASGERVKHAIERAAADGLPVLAMTASGGSRMQEGTLALAQMAKLAGAIRRYRDAAGLYLVYLMHPTTGGVLASWGSLGTVTWAMPGALIGFGGPRVVELLTGKAMPPDVQRAENLLQRGLIDDVVFPADLRARVSAILAVEAARHRPARGPLAPAHPRDSVACGDPWTSVRHARDPARPEARELLQAWATDLTLLRGDGIGGGDDCACLAGIGLLFGIPAVVLAHNRDRERHGPARPGPGAYRKARRAIALADQLRLPLVTIVDTPGAEMSVTAEEGGLSAEIARCLSDMSAAASPTVAVLLGEGGSGGALAFLLADRVVCAEHASLAVIIPEGASAILYRTTERASELAASQGGASWELKRFGIADVVVPERTSADREPEAFVARLGAVVEHELRQILLQDPEARLAARQRRYQDIGNPEGGEA
jgi:acyl-CoA carboxylase subunit beta